jgi:hypothetical protein
MELAVRRRGMGCELETRAGGAEKAGAGKMQGICNLTNLQAL